MFTAATHLSVSHVSSPIQIGLDGLFLPTTRIKVAGARVLEPDRFDAAELHVETTTIMFADVVESVRLIEQDEVANVVRIRTFLKRVAETVVPSHNGIVLERRGDGLLIKFPDARCAASCALELHSHAAQEKMLAGERDTIALRVGVHTAEVLTDSHALFGRGINMTARIAGLANAGETMVSASVRDHLVAEIDADVEDMGECYIKHLETSVRVYRLDRPASRTNVVVSDDLALRPAIAIIPPMPISGGVTDMLSAEVFADCVITVLSKTPEFRVLSRLSTRAYQTRTCDISEIRTKLRADYALMGTAKFSGDSLTLLLQLVETIDGDVIWAEQIKGSSDSLLDADSELIAGVASKLAAAILASQIRIATTARLPNLKSYSLLLAGVGLLHRQQFSEFDRARQLFEALSERHPRHSAPYAWQAAWRVFRVTQGWFDDLAKEVAIASDLARRAVDVDPDDSLSHTVSGLVATNLKRDFSAAEASFGIALQQNNNEPLAWLHQGALKAFLGDGVDALDDTVKARSLSPLDPWNYYFETLSSSAAFAAGDYREAVRLASSSLRANRMHVSTLRVLAMSHAELGLIEDAREYLKQVLAIEPTLTVSRYLSRSPSEGKRMAEICARALRTSGLPE
jgi:adenylate cyclase